MATEQSITAEQRLANVRTELTNNMEEYFMGLSQFHLSEGVKKDLKFILKRTFSIWEKCLDGGNIIDMNELEQWKLKIEYYVDL
jgi:hypothetical protein